jgi:predicted transcriptional regulator
MSIVTEDRGPPPPDWEVAHEDASALAQVLRSLAHPIRVRALLELRNDALSPTELKPRLADPGLTLSTLAYHVRTLADGGMIRLAAATPRRGAMEHHYALTPLGHAMVAMLARVAQSGLPPAHLQPRQAQRLDLEM